VSPPYTVGAPIFQVPPLPSVYSLTRSRPTSYVAGGIDPPLGRVTTAELVGLVLPSL
jgi:hypothetical protein